MPDRDATDDADALALRARELAQRLLDGLMQDAAELRGGGFAEGADRCDDAAAATRHVIDELGAEPGVAAPDDLTADPENPQP